MNETLVILERVNSFYNSAFNSLLLYTIALLAFAGAVIPLMITFFQNRQFRREQNAIKASLSDEFQKEFEKYKEQETDQLTKSVNNEIGKYAEKIEELKKEYDAKIAWLDAGTNHVQGNSELAQKVYSVAFGSFVGCIEGYIRGKDELNLQRVMRAIKNDCLPKMTKTDFDIIKDLEKSCQTLIKNLEDANEYGRYTDYIREVKEGIERAKIRQPNPPA